MSESLRPVRAIAAWVIVGYVGLSLLATVADWLILAESFGLTEAILQSFWPMSLLLLLPAIAVVIATVLSPRVPGARAIAMFAFVEYCALAMWAVIWAMANFVRMLDINLGEFGYSSRPVSNIELVTIAGLATLNLVGAFFAWRVYTASDSLHSEIHLLEQQIAELDEEDEERVTG